jgi:hypothetical protein
MGNESDGGLPPGGTPEQQPCDCGPCPACTEDEQVSNGCTFELGHGSEHECMRGDVWEQARPSAPPRRRCSAKCPHKPYEGAPPCGKYCQELHMHTPPHWCALGHTW